MSVIVAVILGIVQGLCEFLPVSSSGHLLLLNKAFGIDEGGAFFTIMLHIGTLIAVFVVYRKQIWELLKKPFQKKTYMLVLSTLLTVIIYFVGKKLFDSVMESGSLLGVSFLVTAVLLLITDFVADKINKKSMSIDEMNVPTAIGIGAIQGIGILPGISRSGSTIAGARLFGLNKEAAAEYSFLLSIPAIIGGFVTEIPDVVTVGVGDIPWYCFVIGTLVAAVCGYAAIRFMIKLITGKKLWGFSIYLAILGIFVVLDQTLFHLVF